MSREDFEPTRAYAKELHRQRVAKNPKRIWYSVSQLEKIGYSPDFVNYENGQINVRKKGVLYIFYASTGLIAGHKERGIENFIKLLRGESEE